jgi:DNA repair exonuclease SbcCD nuclease subunit
MAKPLKELSDLSYFHKCPVLHSGDLFDKWNAPAELINFALGFLPDMWSIPGQHDLPFHRYGDIRKSAYWTLCQAGKISNLDPGQTYQMGNDFRLTGFPWGYPLKESKKVNDSLDIALVHEYIWTKDKGYPTAPQESKISKAKTKGYDIVSYGDNHKSFDIEGQEGIIWNNGGFMKRHRDEVDHKPRVGLVHTDGTVTSHYLNTDDECYMKMQAADTFTEGKITDMTGFFDTLEGLGDSELDFEKSMDEYVKSEELEEDVVEEINDCMEKDNEGVK